MARLDFRLVPDLTPELVLKLMRTHLDLRGFKDIEIIELGSAPLAKASAKSRVARAVIEPARRSLRNVTVRLSDGSFEWTCWRGLWRYGSATPVASFRHELRWLQSARTRREHQA